MPVKLRSCVTIPTFFSSVLAACDLEDQREKIDDVTARFSWLPEEDVTVIKEKLPDSFAEFCGVSRGHRWGAVLEFGGGGGEVPREHRGLLDGGLRI